jgi:hypothetical protein
MKQSKIGFVKPWQDIQMILVDVMMDESTRLAGSFRNVFRLSEESGDSFERKLTTAVRGCSRESFSIKWNMP